MSGEAMRMALRLLVDRPGRSALTMLGLAIGVAAFIAMVSFGQGARVAVLSQFEVLGSNILRVRVRADFRDALRSPAQPLTDADVNRLRRESTVISHVVPIVRLRGDVGHQGRWHRTMLQGTTPYYPMLHGWRIEAGGMFDATDSAESARVCVLGSTPADELFGGGDAVGSTIMIAGKSPCRVIGVLAGKGSSIGGSDLDEIVLMPVTTFSRFIGMPEGYGSIELTPIDPDLRQPAAEEAEQILRRAHGLSSDEAADFDIVSPDDVTRAADDTARILTGLLASIAAVSLLVGGIGIMNIQLVSVAERTREIGIRAAIGASPGQILSQFLAESCILAAFGSAAGVACGVVAANIVARAMGWPSAISAGTVIGSGLFGVTVGIVFGYLPALRASRLDPIIALRRE